MRLTGGVLRIIDLFTDMISGRPRTGRDPWLVGGDRIDGENLGRSPDEEVGDLIHFHNATS